MLWNLTLREIRSQYKRTALGRLWSLLNPLATIAIFSIIFGFLFQAPPPEGTNSGLHAYALWIACGIIPWTFISGSIQAAMSSITANAGLLTKVYFPRHVLVTSMVMSLVATFLVELLVVMAIMLTAAVFVTGAHGLLVLAYIPVLLVVVAITACFVLGIGLVLAVGVVYFRDIQHLWGIVNQAWFYASGVVFPIAMVESAERLLGEQGITFFGAHIPLVEIFKLNPAFHFLEAYRSVLYDFAMPGPVTWLTMLAWAAAVLLVGVLVFRTFQARIVEEL
ncbi:hypothetical protein GCM10011490_14960 [Pseudoclavibacter endophyticus]|uniref:ABC transporter permease n=1 Tax=Pseudoclavibacter endophyticus TaxID=1778590 RepID=UPI0019AB5DB2|nr:ABC transporter permease [Pseudoclavibacter endophyticus]GGA65295.1 hypothetical protein GCM10011490_14960 [Pseudoclavibacter endophyticus]